MKYFTADSHINHPNIVLACHRPSLRTGDLDNNGKWISESIKKLRGQEMDERMIEDWNDTIKQRDEVYHVGDFAFGKNDVVKKIRQRLNGKIHLIYGNHDYKNKIQRIANIFSSANDILYLKHDRKNIMLCHYAMRVWNRSSYNSWQLYGHCLDNKTEILTNNGWKFRNELKKSDNIVTLNLNNNKLEYNKIKEIVDYNYSGNVYYLKSKGLDLRVTEKHVLIDIMRGSKKFRKFYAEDLKLIDKRNFIKSGYTNNPGIKLSNDYIKLLVWIAADGSICNSNLVRIHVFKIKKINIIKNLLDKLKINYRALPQKNSSISFNFTIPNKLKNYNLKPIDKVIEVLNKNQFKTLLKEYMNTDGYKNGNTYLIYTSKKQEADSIQISSIKNGYSCNISERKNHGYSKKINYELSITKKQNRTCTKIKQKLKIKKANNEHFWCVKVKNKTIFIRRNGKPLIVGNSHAVLPPIGKQYDVGMDNNCYRPISYDELVIIMDNLPDNVNWLKKLPGYTESEYKHYKNKEE